MLAEIWGSSRGRLREQALEGKIGRIGMATRHLDLSGVCFHGPYSNCCQLPARQPLCEGHPVYWGTTESLSSKLHLKSKMIHDAPVSYFARLATQYLAMLSVHAAKVGFCGARLQRHLKSASLRVQARIAPRFVVKRVDSWLPLHIPPGVYPKCSLFGSAARCMTGGNRPAISNAL